VEIKDKFLVFIPTYNEIENVKKIYHKLKKLSLNMDILFIDDNSPDGTGMLLDKLAAKDSSLTVIHQEGKNGIGNAHKVGIRYAYQRGYRILITMDCDFTHPPEDIPNLLEIFPNCDVVVGSRYIIKNSLEDWNFYRKCLTLIGHFLTKTLFKMPYDATGAFRLYHLNRINSRLFDTVKSPGYSFFFESLFILYQNGIKINEIPIKPPQRAYGHSKMAISDIYASVSRLFTLYFNSLINRRFFKVKDIVE